MSEDAVETEAALAPGRVAELVAEGAELVDTRREYEWAGARIPGATHVEVNEVTAVASTLPRGRPIVFYCRTGNRSQMIAEAFRGAGYDAYSLAGGIVAWAEAGHDLEPEGAEIRVPPPAS